VVAGVTVTARILGLSDLHDREDQERDHGPSWGCSWISSRSSGSAARQSTRTSRSASSSGRASPCQSGPCRAAFRVGASVRPVPCEPARGRPSGPCRATLPGRSTSSLAR